MDQEFATKENVDTLWDVIIDTITIPPNKLVQSRHFFNEQLQHFYKSSNTSTSLFQLNTQFISAFIQSYQQLPPAYTSESIQLERQTAFDKDLTARKSELNRYMAPPPPTATPKFTDPVDKPITGMAELVERARAERNYEVVQPPPSSSSQPSTRHPSSSTQLSSTQLSLTQLPSTHLPSPQPPIKYIKIGGEISNVNKEVVELPYPKKTLSWSSDINNELTTASLFSKLKSKPISIEEPDIETKIMHLNNKIDELVNMNTKILLLLQQQQKDR